MPYTTHGPKYIGDMATVFYSEKGGMPVPVLDILPGRGALTAEQAQHLANSIVSVLNGKEPIQ